MAWKGSKVNMVEKQTGSKYSRMSTLYLSFIMFVILGDCQKCMAFIINVVHLT